ncbi:class II fructose-bisphosphate aldolase [Chryseolinea sp. T2]|uniref:class II fructose-bisphosphate aldolase n=1 Tax=Chryseolinea sp. T2 TaxID=3129255 RepID=UPI003078A4F3
MSSVLPFSKAQLLFKLAKRKQFAIPAINVVNTNTINACLRAARKADAPVIVQLSYGGSAFFIGNPSGKSHRDSIAGAIAAAKYVHEISELYGVPVMINTDHCSSALLPWVDALLIEGQQFYEREGSPLFTSHMLDLSELPLHENIEICKRYLERVSSLDMYLEIELGVTGGEEDGVDNHHIESSRLYTQPEDVAYAYEELSKVSNNFVIAASFGNVHGVYRPGNVKLEPGILRNSQELIGSRFKAGHNPVGFVFHGGSGSELDDIRETLDYGVVKMNIDTDMQWAFWSGVKEYYKKNEQYLQSQLGSTAASDSPNKKYYDPRKWLLDAEQSFVQRLLQAYHDLNATGVLKLSGRNYAYSPGGN